MPKPPTLPGSIPGLLQRCSPVLSNRWGSAVVVGVPGDERWDCLEHWQLLADSECFHHAFSDSDDLGLDLTNKTGRVHAEWWLAAATGYPVHPPALEVYSIPLDDHFEETGLLVMFGSAVHAPEIEGLLDHLDPEDSCLLPDGSRWVDAEALRLVCLHVAAEHGWTP